MSSSHLSSAPPSSASSSKIPMGPPPPRLSRPPETSRQVKSSAVPSASAPLASASFPMSGSSLPPLVSPQVEAAAPPPTVGDTWRIHTEPNKRLRADLLDALIFLARIGSPVHDSHEGRLKQAMTSVFSACIVDKTTTDDFEEQKEKLLYEVEANISSLLALNETGAKVDYQQLPFTQQVQDWISTAKATAKVPSTPSASSLSARHRSGIKILDIALLLRLSRESPSATDTVLFFVEVKTHAPDIQRLTPEEMVGKAWVSEALREVPTIMPSDRHTQTRLALGQAACDSLALQELHGNGVVGTALINQRFSRMYAVDDVITVEMAAWPGATDLDAQQFLNHSSLHEHVTHNLIKGWSINTQYFALDEDALQCLLRTAQTSFERVATHPLAEPLTRPVFKALGPSKFQSSHNLAAKNQASRKAFAGAARPYTIGKGMWTIAAERKKALSTAATATKKRKRKEDEDPGDGPPPPGPPGGTSGKGDKGDKGGKGGKGRGAGKPTPVSNVATRSQSKVNSKSRHARASATKEAKIVTSRQPSAKEKARPFYLCTTACKHRSMVLRWARDVARSEPLPVEENKLAPLDECEIQRQRAMPDEAQADEGENGLTASQAIVVLQQRGVRFRIVSPVEFDQLLGLPLKA